MTTPYFSWSAGHPHYARTTEYLMLYLFLSFFAIGDNLRALFCHAIKGDAHHH